MSFLIENTFIHIPKITRNSEINIWKNNILTWEDFVRNTNRMNIAASKKALIAEHIQSSIDALKNKNHLFFNTLPSNQHWRMYNTLKDNACFLDIETTGLSKYHNDITLIGIHSSSGTKIFMNGKDLDRFQQELKKYPIIITFNGKCFDLPFIKAKYPDVETGQYHIDLRYALAELGYRGGLKSIEREFSIIRDDELQDVDGFEAVRLWHRYQRGDNSSLALLKRYLTSDVENLRILMDQSFAMLRKKHFEDIIHHAQNRD